MTRRRSRRGRSRSQFSVKALACTAGAAVMLGGIGYFAYIGSLGAKAGKDGCYPPVNAHTAVWLDSSEPRFDKAQTRDLNRMFGHLYGESLHFNERLSIIATEAGLIGSIPPPIMSFCRYARTPQELESVGATPQVAAYLQTQAAKFHSKTFEPAIQKLLDPEPSPDRRQTHESPILEQVQGIANWGQFSGDLRGRRLVVVSDMLQNTSEAQFCYRKGDLPSFDIFKKRPYFQKVKPKSLAGVKVRIYMLVRWPDGQAPHCTEDELAAFWLAYFKDAGAADVELIRLRRGV